MVVRQGCAFRNYQKQLRVWCIVSTVFYKVLRFVEKVYIKHAVENIITSNVPKVVAENPLDKLDCRFWQYLPLYSI